MHDGSAERFRFWSTPSATESTNGTAQMNVINKIVLQIEQNKEIGFDYKKMKLKAVSNKMGEQNVQY